MLFAPALPSEHDALVALVNSAYRGQGAQAGWTTEAGYIDGQRIDLESLRADLAAAPQALILTARDDADGPILGCVWLEPAEAGAWYLGMLTIRPDLQDRQLGRTLLAAGEDHARERGAKRMRMTVVHIRDTLIAWYERRGYALTGETRPFPHGDDRFGKPLREDLAFVVMEKAL
ncbi:GNAT family N-acetyltransferase [Caulobacter flavus]|uniref:GNAT family N-acetyltransferase n=1 Tax=Caulobacter flavus TaxID=1679497 RepID=A0A2N5CN99_9CAUL|nr:GNAT family N-acetyltransferase [Caulobacter flavus]AYV46655.1 GNAT family N-acetyltransferase [Caulobacter flavus]PLR07891.1 GNAT family N-acetyltransferase [Caulobacter flavus]